MKKLFLIIIVLFTANCLLYPQPKEGDRIIAIVGNDIILESDFQYQLQLYARENNIKQISPVLAQQLFEQLLTEKIIYAKALQDSIIVTPDEVNKELDYRLKGLIEELGSEQKLEEIYGMSLAKIRYTLKEELEKKLMADKLRRKKFSSGIKVSDKEVNDFFNTYRDSLPQAGEEYELAHIFVIRKVSNEEKNAAKEKALSLLDSIKNGMNFDELARKYSNDSLSALNGGDLGFARKGIFVKEFEETLFSLKENEISDLVETEYGYHIIKLNEIRADQRKAQHILVAFPKFESADMEVIKFLKDLKARIEKNEITFEEAANLYSQDKDNYEKGGYIGFVPVERLDSTMLMALNNLEVNQITEPLRIGGDNNYGYEVFKLLSKSPAHKLSMEKDYKRIRRYAEIYKENMELDKWINELKKTIYVEVKF